MEISSIAATSRNSRTPPRPLDARVTFSANAQLCLEQSDRRSDRRARRLQQVGQGIGFRLMREDSYDGRGINEHQAGPLRSS